MRGRIAQNVFLGSVTQLLVELQTGETLTVHELNDDEEAARLAPGAEVTVGWATRQQLPGRQEPTAASRRGRGAVKLVVLALIVCAGTTVLAGCGVGEGTDAVAPGAAGPERAGRAARCASSPTRTRRRRT